MKENANRITILNRLLNLERFSLANYLQYARPVIRSGDEALYDVVKQIASGQLNSGRRIARLIERHKGSIEPAQGFPAAYTACNDLAIHHVLDRLIKDQERIVREVETCLADLHGDQEAEHLAAEVLSSEQVHRKKLLAFRGTQSTPTIGLARAA